MCREDDASLSRNPDGPMIRKLTRRWTTARRCCPSSRDASTIASALQPILQGAQASGSGGKSLLLHALDRYSSTRITLQCTKRWLEDMC